MIKHLDLVQMGRRHTQEAAEDTDFATKSDITELKAEITAVRSELREVELRFEARLKAIKSEILNRVFGLILGATVINVVAIVGAMFGIAILLGH